MKANIKLPVWFPIIIIIVAAFFAIIDIGILTFVITGGALYLLIYFLLGYIRRKDAIIIEGNLLKVKSPFKTKEYEIDKLSNLSLVDNDSMLKGIYDNSDRKITLCTGIYDVPLGEILLYLVTNYPHLSK